MNEQPTVKPLNHDLRFLRRRVRRLAKIRTQRLDDAICDIIDLKGFGLAVLLEGLPRLPSPIGRRVARKVEDVLFFHPNRGKKLCQRLVKTVKAAPPECWPSLVAALADVVARNDQPDQVLEEVADEALALVATGIDLTRKGKAVEILSRSDRYEAVPAILLTMRTALAGVDQFAGFTYLETCLFAMKRLGGESLLRLLVNPTATAASQHLRLHWRGREPAWLSDLQHAVAGLPEDFPQIMLKVVELAEFNLPFAAMIHEGLTHKDKWVRQAAAASMTRMTNADGFEHLQRMLEDPAAEVRLMAATSLGNYRSEDTGDLLVDLALNEKETLDIRLNALYSLFSQKNLGGLARAIQSPDRTVSLNAQGVSALLMEREDGLKALLQLLPQTPQERLPDLFHYLLELVRPEDLPALLAAHDDLVVRKRGEQFLTLLRTFLEKQAGPNLDKELAKLDPARRRALEALLPPPPETP